MTIETNKATGAIATAVATTEPDIESQRQQQTADAQDENAGRGMGIAMFVLLVVGFIFNFIPVIGPVVAFVCIIIVIVLSSTISCGCCCASDYNLKPHVKRWSTATLLCLVIMFVVQIIGFVAVLLTVGTEVSNTGTLSQSTVDGSSTAVTIIWVLSIILNILALAFSAIFTWGRGCCVPIS